MKRSFPRFDGRTHTARSLALQVLLDCQRGGAFAPELLDHSLTLAALSPPDRRLATLLVYGVLRRRGTLDALLRPMVSRPSHRVEPWLWETLRLGTFQLALMTQIPPHAALHETVELAAVFQRPASKGFLNGVLRAVERLLSEERVPSPAADALPLEEGHYRRLRSPVLPEPAVHPVEYFAAAFSVPPWLAGRWIERYPWEECVRLGFWFAGPAPLWLRCNRLRVERADLLKAFAEAGIAATAGAHPQAVRVTVSVPIRDLPGYEQGWFAVQDESAMRVATALTPAAGSLVLDMCAAPGGKTTHLAELMGNQGRIIACDVDDRRLATLVELCGRLGLGIVETCRLQSERNEEPPAGPFDAILVDVPCSNTGVLGRRPEARWRLRPNDFRHLAPLQTRLLIQAGERIRPGGAIVYSTCGIEPEENGKIVRAALQTLPELMLEAEEEQVPGRPADGGYWARLRRKSLKESVRSGNLIPGKEIVNDGKSNQPTN